MQAKRLLKIDESLRVQEKGYLAVIAALRENIGARFLTNFGENLEKFLYSTKRVRGMSFAEYELIAIENHDKLVTSYNEILRALFEKEPSSPDAVCEKVEDVFRSEIRGYLLWRNSRLPLVHLTHLSGG